MRRPLNFVDDDLSPCRVEEKAGVGQGSFPSDGIVEGQVGIIGKCVREECRFSRLAGTGHDDTWKGGQLIPKNRFNIAGDVSHAKSISSSSTACQGIYKVTL